MICDRQEITDQLKQSSDKMCEGRKDAIKEETDLAADGDERLCSSDKDLQRKDRKRKNVISRKVQICSRYFQKEIVKFKIMFLCGVSKRRQSSPFEDCENYSKSVQQATNTNRRPAKTLRKKNIKLVRVKGGTNPKVKIVNSTKSTWFF